MTIRLFYKGMGSLALLFCWQAATAAMRDDVEVLTQDKQGAHLYSDALRSAWTYYRRADLQNARSVFEEVLAHSDVPVPDRIQALYGRGLSAVYQRPDPDIDSARQSFTEIVERYSESAIAPWALIELGNLSNHKEDPFAEEAIPFFEQVLSNYPNHVAIHEATLRLANAYFYRLDKESSDRALTILEEHLLQYPDNPLAEVMLLRVDYWYAVARQDFERSIPFAVELGHRGMNDPFRWSRQYWHIAEMYRSRLGMKEKAVPWYQRIIEEMPESVHTFTARQRLKEVREGGTSSGQEGSE